MTIEIRHRQVATNGIELHVAEAGEGPLVVLCHGFPESWYSWRHQIVPIAEAGYHVIAPDLRGYGDSTKLPNVDDYGIEKLNHDLLGLVDDAGEEQAVFVGHDWGALIVWDLARLHPERVRGVVGVSVPLMNWPARARTADARGVRRALLHRVLPRRRAGRDRDGEGRARHDDPYPVGRVRRLRSARRRGERPRIGYAVASSSRCRRRPTRCRRG